MIFKSTGGEWTYAVVTEDSDCCVIEEHLIFEPIQLGKNFSDTHKLGNVTPPVNEIIVESAQKDRKKLKARRIPHSKRKRSRPLDHKDPSTDVIHLDHLSQCDDFEFTDTASIDEELTFNSDNFFDNGDDER